MVLVPAVNVIFLITLNSAIPLYNSSNSLVVTNATHELSTLTWPPSDGDCRRKATCVTHNATCFGVPLPYMETSTDIVSNLFRNPNLANYKVLEQDLQRWESLKKIPKCWNILQPFLCSLYMPKCEQDAVYLLTQKRCRFTMSTCKVLKEQPFADIFQSINCDDVEYFSGTCKHDVKEPKSNITGECVPPLIQTGDSKSEYDVVTGCGVQCQDPLYTEEEHELIHGRIAWVATISLFCNLFAVVTFSIDWPSANKYPALIIFYINVCFLISNLGWLIQFMPNAREDIVCKKDMTLRKFQPSQGENLSCVIVFIIVYYFIMAAIVWFVILTYAWHLWFRALGQTIHKSGSLTSEIYRRIRLCWSIFLIFRSRMPLGLKRITYDQYVLPRVTYGWDGKIQERIDKKGAYFHLVAWSLPAVLTLTTLASGQIEGNSIAGICFIRSSHWGARVALLLAPIATSVAISGYYLSRGLLFLYSIKKDSQQILSEKASSKIREMIIRIGIFYFLCITFVVMTFVFHVYEFTFDESWQRSFRNYIFCLILQSKSEPRECEMDSKPNSTITQLHLLIMFAAGINMSSWVWTRSAAFTWKRFFNRKIFKKELEEPIILKKHKIIAQAFAKRKELTNAGKLELSIRNSHTDPVGLKFELNSIASHVSSNWIAAVPKLVDRRGALIGATTESNSSKRRNSYDSESYTYSVRRVSVESRRHSLDSQISLQISEVTATHKTNTPRPQHRSARNRGKKRRKDFGRTRRYYQNGTRRGSSTSQESQIGIKMLTALALNNSSILPSLLKRRSGNAGLECDNSVSRKFSMPENDLSDDEQSQEHNLVLSDDYVSNNSDDDLCPLGQGIQTLGLAETDSDINIKIDCRPDDSEYETTEIEKIEEILKREKAITARESNKNKLQIRDLEYHKKSFKRDRKGKVKTDDYLNKSYRNCKFRNGDASTTGSRRKRHGEDVTFSGRSLRQQIKGSKVEERRIRGGYKSDKRRKSSASDLEESLTMCKRNSESETERTNCQVFKTWSKNGVAVALQKCNGIDGKEAKGEDSEGEYGEESRLMAGVQMRSGSSRSKRSFTVDAATQISTQETATQTDPHDYNGGVQGECSTSNQGTQMTPPLHIRLINKDTVSNVKGSCKLTEKNCSYSSLTDQ